MKIYSILLAKNEADIIRSSLLDACRWSDKIIVMDNGSTDGTWEIVQELSQTEPKIIPFMQYCGPFHIGLRSKAFYAYKKEMKRGDWWCVRLDADEFFVGDVRGFLQKVPRRFRTIKKESTDYVLTQEDINTIPFSGDFEKDKVYITHFKEEKRRERRFMRHSWYLIWKNTWRQPHPWGRVWKEYLPVNHYQYRNPEQMQKRYETRQKAKADGCGTFKHEQGKSWEEYIKN